MKIEEAVSLLRKNELEVPISARLPTEGEVQSVEKELGVIFHEDYRYYLLNGSNAVYGTLEPAMVTLPKAHFHLPILVTSARKSGVPERLLPICSDNGNFYCIAESGIIEYFSHNGTSKESWPNLAEWIVRVWLKINDVPPL